MTMFQRYFIGLVALGVVACSAPQSQGTEAHSTEAQSVTAPQGEAVVPSTPEAPAAEEGKAPASTEAPAQAQFPVTVTDLRGEHTFEQAPQRIVTLEFAPMDALALLGVKPVGIAADGDQANEVLPHLRPYYPAGSAELVGNRLSPSLEAITALNPDLIIADERGHTQLYDQLSNIAPTLLYRSYRGSYQDQIDQFRDISHFTGNAQAGQQALEQHQQLLNEVKGVTSPEAGRVVVGVLVPKGFYVHSDQSYLGSILTELGADNPAKLQEGETQYPVSMEGLAKLNPDTLIVLFNPEHQNVYQEFVANPVVQQVPAAQAGRIYTFNRDTWAKGRGLIGLRGILTDMRDSKVLSGEPAPKNQSVEPKSY